MAAALQGITVLDLSRVLAGPWASQLLADYGANVIKIERPGQGDDTRSWGPPWLPESGGESAYFLSCNRNKQSVTVNIASAEGQAVIRDLAQKADVVVENFKVGTLKRYRLDAESLQEINPRLVYCSITAYGQQGTRAADAGYDAMIQASAGLMSVTGEPDGMPQKTGVAIADIMAGMYACTAILAALHARQQSGAGQVIDVPLYDSQVAWLANQAMNYLVTGETPARHGNAHPNIVPYQSFATADGVMMLAVGNDRQFKACVACLGLPGLAEDLRFISNAQRVAHRRELLELLEPVLASRTTDSWISLLQQHAVPCGPVNDLAEVFSGAQVAERQLVQHLPHVTNETVPTVANPVRMSATPPELRSAPPILGQHTDEVLSTLLGYSPAKIAELRNCGAL